MTACGVLAAVIGTTVGVSYALPVLFVAALLVVLLRLPKRSRPAIPLAVLAPIDACACMPGTVYDPYLKRQAVGIELRQRWRDSVLLSSPIEGKVSQLLAGHTATDPEAIHVSVITTDEGWQVVIAIKQGILGLLRCRLQPGERVGQGQRIGMLGWGRTVTVLLPIEVYPELQSETAVRGAQSILARLPSGDAPHAGR